MARLWQNFTALIGLAAIYFSPVGPRTWSAIQRIIKQRFPNVRQLAPQSLAAWLEDARRPEKPLLIDTRSAAEFAVSHLPGAVRLTSVEQMIAANPTKACPVITYCSVGYRSSALAAKLQRAGFSDVQNLEGSIFAWANEGRTVCRDGKPLHPARVHPYDAKWGQLLKAELRAER